MKIVSVRDKRVKALVENPNRTSVKGLDARETRKISDMIVAIRLMEHPRDLLVIASWRCHELIPGYPGKWALMVTGNWRLTFYADVKAQEVSLLDYEDYH